MSFKFPEDGAKVQALGRENIGIPAVILSQLHQVLDQVDTIVVSVVDTDGELHTFSSRMSSERKTYHMVTTYDDLLRDLNDPDTDVPDDDGAA